jgi:hypothetical protein
MMDTIGGAALLALRERESLLAIEGPQRFRFDDIVSGGSYHLVKRTAEVFRIPAIRSHVKIDADDLDLFDIERRTRFLASIISRPMP